MYKRVCNQLNKLEREGLIHDTVFLELEFEQYILLDILYRNPCKNKEIYKKIDLLKEEPFDDEEISDMVFIYENYVRKNISYR